MLYDDTLPWFCMCHMLVYVNGYEMICECYDICDEIICLRYDMLRYDMLDNILYDMIQYDMICKHNVIICLRYDKIILQGITHNPDIHMKRYDKMT